MKFISKGIELVTAYLLAYLESKRIEQKDVVEVWHAYVLGNEKWMIAVLKTDMYFEVTFNSTKDEYYIDRYDKTDHKVVFNAN